MLYLLYCVFRFLFNDAEVKQFDPSQIATECFGGEMTVRAIITYRYISKDRAHG